MIDHHALRQELSRVIELPNIGRSYALGSLVEELEARLLESQRSVLAPDVSLEPGVTLCHWLDDIVGNEWDRIADAHRQHYETLRTWRDDFSKKANESHTA